ncbi:SDR family NAD(P)-dependent oxidoreductase [Cryptosporangium minutisporangium]|uniref:SDR family oxidoreductase n=1 Tax=Cryptosporangium minutisporangium TaxID=113569 RepID=A0ABP6T150_9ACTN
MVAAGLDLRGQRVVLTGASSGIGRVLAKQLAATGARIALVARRTDLLEELAKEVTADGHPKPLVLTADLSRAGVAVEVAHRAMDELGGVDILVNNAGASLTGALSRHSDSEAARAIFGTNLWSPLALGAAVIPSMRSQRHGTIVNVTSTIQSVPLPLLGYYASSKAALAQATRSLREELADTDVRVLEVIPGGTDTALRDVDSLPWKGSPPRMIRPTSAEKVAAAIVRALRRGRKRLAYPSYVLAPLEVPALGRLLARVGGRRIDSVSALPAID